MSDFLIKQAFAEAMDLQKNNQFDKAKEIYKKILKVDKSEPNAHHLISLIFMAEGNFPEAKKHIETAIDAAPTQAIFLSNYGSLLHTMGDNQGAIKAIKKSLKIDKKLLQSYYSLGIIYTDLDEVDKAIENYNKALEVDNDISAVHNNLANLFSSMNNPEAEYHYKKLIDLVPQEIYPRLNMSNYLIKNKKYKEALQHLEELLQMDLTSKEVFNSLGVAYKGLDDDTNAAKMFNKALEIDSEFSLARKNLDGL